MVTRKGNGKLPTGDELARRLGRLRLLAGLSADEVAEITLCVSGNIRRYSKGDIIVHEGTRASWVIPVLRGRIDVYESGASGERHLVRVVDEEGLFGATLVTANLDCYPGMAVASESCEVVFLSISDIRALWRKGKCRCFFENLYSVVSGEVLDCWQKLSVLSCRRTEDRFMLYLRWRASKTGETDVRLPFQTSEACAQFLGVTRTALSLAVKRLVARGEIARVERGRFVLIR